MNRRGFLGRLTGAAAVGAAGLPAVTEAKRATEPFPRPFAPLKRLFATSDPDPIYLSSYSSEIVGTVHMWTTASLHPIPYENPMRHWGKTYTELDGNECLSTDCDLSATGVAASLDKLQWTPKVGNIALLCVHPSNYALALKIAKAYGDELSVHAERFCDDSDTWFVAWNGKRYGSLGG